MCFVYRAHQERSRERERFTNISEVLHTGQTVELLRRLIRKEFEISVYSERIKTVSAESTHDICLFIGKVPVVLTIRLRRWVGCVGCLGCGHQHGNKKWKFQIRVNRHKLNWDVEVKKIRVAVGVGKNTDSEVK